MNKSASVENMRKRFLSIGLKNIIFYDCAKNIYDFAKTRDV